MTPRPHPASRRTFLSGSAAFAAGLATALPGLAAAQESGATPASADAARREVERLRETILRISREVWETPELSLEEELSHQIHLRELRDAGFDIVSTNTSNIPTAFVAEWSQGEDGPIIGFLPEYDALPDLGNAAEPFPDPGPTGAEVGHGCGHNMLGASCTGAAIALKAMMIAEGIPGTLRVYGCAAEETEGAKVYMARDGLFEDCDACLAWHSAPVTGTGLVRTAALNSMRISFSGVSAHAGIAPWEGRSALDAAELFGTGIQYMREHIQPTSRLQYVFTSAGAAPNVVPDFAEVLVVIRDAERAEVVALTEWVRGVAEGAAAMTQTEAEIDLFFGLHDTIPNAPLVSRIHAHMSALPIAWTEEEQAFARECQRNFGVAEAGLSDVLLPLFPETTVGGSTDVGDVSYLAPTGLFAWAAQPLGIGLHTWPVTACGGMSIGDKAAIAAAIVMTGVGYDLLTDPDLRAAVRTDFEARLGGRAYVSPLPEGKLRPSGVPAHLIRKTGEAELITGVLDGSRDR